MPRDPAYTSMWDDLPDEDYVDVASDGTAELVHPDGSREPMPEGWDKDHIFKATKLNKTGEGDD